MNDKVGILDNEPKKKTGHWVALAGFLAAAILVFDFFTKGIGLVETVWSYAIGEGSGKVSIAVRERSNASSCLAFAFEDIPEGFSLGSIILNVVDKSGPTPISGEMASKIHKHVVNQELSQEYLVGAKTEIEFPAAIQSDRAKDAFYVDYCPTLEMPGTKGSITVVPSLISPAGDALSDLTMQVEEYKLELIRPKSAVVDVDTKRLELVVR